MTVSLNLSKESLQLNLTKRNVGTIQNLDVSFAMDVSGSFDDEHRAGYTQSFLNRFVPFSLLFDPDKKMGMYVFSSDHENLDDVTESNFDGYIRNKVMRSSVYGYGTKYAPVLEEILKPQSVGLLKSIFGAKAKPKLCFFVTDGEPMDANATLETLRQKHGQDSFIVLVSISDSKISFLEKMEAFDGVTHLQLSPAYLRNIENVSDDELYEKLLNDELVAWLKKYEQ